VDWQGGRLRKLALLMMRLLLETNRLSVLTCCSRQPGTYSPTFITAGDKYAAIMDPMS
jgi:hypothetical protein